MKTAVLLVNLGTPDSPKRNDVARYLTQFLNDPRVIDISPIGRAILVNGLIVPTRSGKSARLYSEIWSDQGSPLMYHSEALVQKVQEALGPDFDVALAMRYQNPGIEAALKRFENPVYSKLIVFPLFPQYASASTGSVHEEIMRIVSKWQVIPPIEFVNSYCNHPDFINAWMKRAAEYDLKDYDHVVFSYHGLPERQMRKADHSKQHCLTHDACCSVFNEKNLYCYRAQCFETTRHLVKELGLKEDGYSITFQSRLGRDPWIKPYTDEVLAELAAKGKKRLLVFAPAFVADCLETVYEISVEYQELFEEKGGTKVQLVESLNSHPAWVDAIVKMLQKRKAD